MLPPQPWQRRWKIFFCARSSHGSDRKIQVRVYQRKEGSNGRHKLLGLGLPLYGVSRYGSAFLPSRVPKRLSHVQFVSGAPNRSCSSIHRPFSPVLSCLLLFASDPLSRYLLRSQRIAFLLHFIRADRGEDHDCTLVGLLAKTVYGYHREWARCGQQLARSTWQCLRLCLRAQPPVAWSRRARVDGDGHWTAT